jgi:protein O-GlcNAc transferase
MSNAHFGLMPAPPDQGQRDAAALFARALAFHQAGLSNEAGEMYRKLLLVCPEHFDGLHMLGVVEYQRGEHHAALALMDRALSINPRAASAHNNRGVVLAAMMRLEEAVASYDQALAAAPGYVDAFINRGNALRDLRRFEDALASYDRAVVLDPTHAEAFNKRGNALTELQRFEEAAASYARAIALRPAFSEAFNNQGVALVKLKRFEEAIASFERAITLNPDISYLRGLCLYAQMHICDWRRFEEECTGLHGAIARGVTAVDPFHGLAWSSSPQNQLQCARIYVPDGCATPSLRLWNGERYAHSRIRVAYLSSDLRDHPVAFLTAGLFEQHDRRRFETIAISYKSDAAIAIRKRLQGAFDRFVDAQAMSDQEVAKLVRALEVDIAVDLNGFTDGCRPGVFASRPAPVQVNYLGYAGTLGQNFWDYIIADPFVIPADARENFAEQVVYLPETFLVTDAGHRISAHTPSRKEAGLPDTGLVLCCFNNSFKITPAVFDVWMRLLRAAEGSVLWLSATNTSAPTNLRREAERRGVSADRLIFAARLPLKEDHSARHRLADLCLDTSPYNAHATASDALWTGVPVLTCSGTTFASRVAGSLLQAVGLP